MAQPRWDSEEEEGGKGGKKIEKSWRCISNPSFAFGWLRNEGPFKLPSSTASTELSSSGRFVFLKVPQLFHDDSPIHYEYLLLWSKAVTFFFFSLPFKFGFKCAHMHTHTYLLSTTREWMQAGRRKGDGKRRWERAVGCVLYELLCTCSLWEASDLSPSKRTLGHWRLLWNMAGFECICACLSNETQKIYFPIRVTDISFLLNVGLDLFPTEFSDCLQFALSVDEPSSKDAEIMWSLMPGLA